MSEAATNAPVPDGGKVGVKVEINVRGSDKRAYRDHGKDQAARGSA